MNKKINHHNLNLSQLHHNNKKSKNLNQQNKLVNQEKRG